MTWAGRRFRLDPFQKEAIAALDDGRSVLVSAPTGAGKTVVAEHAVSLALERGGRAFYTTPIKALSNQKYVDLVGELGADRVGLLTGDNAINGGAPVVVMTTEVLRNMLYAGRPLDDLQFVVLDEVHYLQDAYRGPVWEEVIIHTPAHVRMVCLSATVSNAEELAAWLTEVRGPTAVVRAAGRPVDLRNLYLVGDRDEDRLHLLPTLVDGEPNPDADRFDADPRGRQRAQRPRRRYYSPRRTDVIDLLERRDILPAIYFIFSRAGCDDAVGACLSAGVHLTTPEERSRIRAITDERTAALGEAELAALGTPRWAAGLESGVAAHHAGMVPVFREITEACFSAGLVKVVFATETLALGINMPARTVVIERLRKFTGERHEDLSPGQYTQLTGRAGRRGIDVQGHAVALWSPFVPFRQVAALAASRSFELRSAFRPTYNMASNLVRRYDRDEAHRLLEQSFAQFRADREVVGLRRRLDERAARLSELRADARCELGDVEEYRRLLGKGGQRRPARRDVARAMARLRPGDVVRLAAEAEPAAVLSVSQRRGGSVRMQVIKPGRQVVRLSSRQLAAPPDRLTTIELPAPFAPNTDSFQREVAERLRSLTAVPADGDGDPDHDRRSPAERHPVAACADAAAHVRAARRAERVERELTRLRRRVKSRTGSVARDFDRVLAVLESRGYVRGWELTERGARLARIYHETDLLVAECLDAGLFDDLDAGDLAGLCSCLTYEHRSAKPAPPPWFPSSDLRDRFGAMERLAARLAEEEEANGLSPGRQPDPGFVAAACSWAAGDSLERVLSDDGLSGGDFVRNVRQLLDLLRQLSEVTPRTATAAKAREAADRLHRGVVVATVGVGSESEGTSRSEGSSESEVSAPTDSARTGTPW